MTPAQTGGARETKQRSLLLIHELQSCLRVHCGFFDWLFYYARKKFTSVSQSKQSVKGWQIEIKLIYTHGSGFGQEIGGRGAEEPTKQFPVVFQSRASFTLERQ